MTRSIRIKLSFVTMLVIFTLLVGTFIPNGVVQAKGLSGLAVSPEGYTSDTTPTFKWYKVSGATQYQFQLYKGTILIYTKTAYASNCIYYLCKLTPSTTLTLNSYKWRVRYYSGGVWSTWLPFLFFSITTPPTDFNSNFNGSQGGDWTANPGAAWLVGATALYTNGLAGKASSIYRNTSKAYANFDFVARVKRTTGTDVNYLAVRMGDDFAASNLGYRGYIFGYTNAGDFMIFRCDIAGACSVIQDYTPTEAIVKYGWNELRVTAIGNHFTYFINGFPVMDFVNFMAETGSVGFIMYKSGTTTTKFQVDYAYLRVLLANDARPVTISAKQQALNEAAMQDGVSSSPFTPPAK